MALNYFHKNTRFFHIHNLSSAYMQMIVDATIQNLRLELRKLLPKVFSELELRAALKTLQEKHSLSQTTKNKLSRIAIDLEVHWNKRKRNEFFRFADSPPIDLDILEAWNRQKACYLSHYSALYLNGLVKQRPKDHFLTLEVKGKSRAANQVTALDQLTVRQAFLKAARVSQNFFTLDKQKFYLLEKIPFSEPGVVDKKMTIDKSTYNLRVTSPERTLIDSIMSPHYSGGIGTVVNSFENHRIDVVELLYIYKKLNPIYPYWQSIGLILERLGQNAQANAWESHYMGLPKIDFYLAHEARQSWAISERWNVAYPKEVFHGS